MIKAMYSLAFSECAYLSFFIFFIIIFFFFVFSFQSVHPRFLYRNHPVPFPVPFPADFDGFFISYIHKTTRQGVRRSAAGLPKIRFSPCLRRRCRRLLIRLHSTSSTPLPPLHSKTHIHNNTTKTTQKMARTRQSFNNSTGTQTILSRRAKTRARNAIASHFHRPHPITTEPRSPPLNRSLCLCHHEVLRNQRREACWSCNRWHHMSEVVPYGLGADHIDSCIYVWLWPRPTNPGPDDDPEPYRPCRLCRDLTCHDPNMIPRDRMCPWCARPFRPTGAQAQARWDRIFAAETFQAYAGRVLMGEGKGDWNLRKRLAEFDPQRFVRCHRDLLGARGRCRKGERDWKRRSGGGGRVG